MKNLMKFGVLFVVLALVTAACAAETADTEPAATVAQTEAPATEAPTTEAPVDTEAPMEMAPLDIVVGYLLPQTGGLAVIIDALVKPIEMAVAEINAAGGSVTLIPGDSGTDPAVASATVDQLLNDGVPAIIGAAASGVSLSVIDKITGSQVVQCSPSNTAASLTTYADGGYYFRTAPSDVLQGPALADVIADDGMTNVAVVYRNDEYGSGFNDVVVAGLEDSGLTVVATVAYDPAATTFDAEVAQVAEAGPDAVVVVSFSEGAAVLQAMIEAGIGPSDVAIYVTDGFKDSVSAADVDPNNPAVLEGVKGTAPSAAPASGEATFPDRFAAFAPDVPTIFSSQAFDCLMTIVLAAEQGGAADGPTIQANMISVTTGGEKCTSYEACHALIAEGKDIDYDGASGPLEFNETGEPSVGTYDVYVYDAEGNAQTLEQLVYGG